VDKEEFKTAMWEIGEKPDDAEIDAIFAEVDTDNSGSVGFDEFVTLST